MIFRPVDAYPNNGIFIDASQYNEFTVKVQGASSQVNAYQIFFYDANTFELINKDSVKNDLSKIYVSGETIEIPVFKGTLKNDMSYYWVVRLFQTNPDMFIYKAKVITQTSNTIINIPMISGVTKGMYVEYLGSYHKITDIQNQTEVSPQVTQITIEDSITGVEGEYIRIYSDYVDSIEFPFYTETNIVARFSDNIPTIVTSRTQDFKMEVSSGTSIKWYRFVLSDESGDIIDDTGKIYNSLLTYSFDGFVSDNNYIIKGYVCDSNNRTVTTDDYSFFVEYNAPDLNLPATTTIDYDNDAIKVSWVDDAYSEGRATGEYSFVDSPIDGKKELKINSGTIIYDNISGYPLNTSEEFTIFVDVEFDQDKRGKLIELLKKNGNYYIYVKENNIYVVKDDEETLLGKVLNTEKGCLQANNTAEEKVAYIWNDEEVWDDTKYWTESLPFSQRFKITILANETLIEEVV